MPVDCGSLRIFILAVQTKAENQRRQLKKISPVLICQKAINPVAAGLPQQKSVPDEAAYILPAEGAVFALTSRHFEGRAWVGRSQVLSGGLQKAPMSTEQNAEGHDVRGSILT